MRTVAVGEFKAKCLALIEDVRTRREPLLITKRGVPVAELIPLRSRRPGEPSALRGSIIRDRDIVSPSGDAWEAAG